MQGLHTNTKKLLEEAREGVDVVLGQMEQSGDNMVELNMCKGSREPSSPHRDERSIESYPLDYSSSRKVKQVSPSQTKTQNLEVQTKIHKLKSPTGWSYLIIPPLKEDAISLDSSQFFKPDEQSRSTPPDCSRSPKQEVNSTDHKLMNGDLSPPKGWNYLIIPPTKLTTPPSKSNDSTFIPQTTNKKPTTTPSEIPQTSYTSIVNSTVGSPTTLPGDNPFEDGLKPPTGWNYIMIPPMKQWMYPSKPTAPPSTSIYTSQTDDTNSTKISQPSHISVMNSTVGSPTTPPVNKLLEDRLKPPTGWKYVMIPPMNEWRYPSQPTAPRSTSGHQDLISHNEDTNFTNISQPSHISVMNSTVGTPTTPSVGKPFEDGLKPPTGWNYTMIPPMNEWTKDTNTIFQGR